VKRRQNVRRLEIIAIVCIVAVSVGVGFYFALTAGDPRSAVDGKLVPPSIMTALYQTATSNYGLPGTTYWQTLSGNGHLATLSGPEFKAAGKPVFIYVGAEYCPYCAVQRWSMTLALMRFGNFTNLHYMTSALTDGDFSTLTYYNSSYASPYVAFQPFETETRTEGTPLMTLPSNYSAAFQTQGGSAFPFLNFANEYYLSGAILDPGVLGGLNQTQIIAQLQQPGSTLGSEIRQGANVITALICETTGNNPSTVCDNPSITALTTLTLSYTLPSQSQNAQLTLASSVTESSTPETFLAELSQRGST